MQKRLFKQLTYRDRQIIQNEVKLGQSLSQIALKIGKNKSTISREIKRNTITVSAEEQIRSHCINMAITVQEFKKKKSMKCDLVFKDRTFWSASEAEKTKKFRQAEANKIRCGKDKETQKWVIEKLKDNWSPEQIAGRSEAALKEKISHEYVYTLVKKNRKEGGNLYKHLKRFGKRKQRFNSREYKPTTTTTSKVSIEDRPKIVDEKCRPGDLEADLIQGYKSDGYILSVIDRKTRFLVLRKLKYKTKKLVNKELQNAFKKFPIIHTLTVDNGSEFSGHKDITEKTGVEVYFCHPYTSTERGAIENANGLVRYYYPKKTPFKALKQSQLNQTQVKLNTRPRKCLNFLTPKERHHIETKPQFYSVAFDT